jgi:predicted Zn-dependent peptidase
MEDLDAATIDDIREFFRVYYAPNNAVITIVGDFDPREARALAEKYFSTIPAQPRPAPAEVDEPEEVASRRETYRDPFAQLPGLILGWKTPARRTPDGYALSLATDLLLEGDSSRLYQRLVKDEESVVGIQGGIGERRGPSSLYVFAIPKPGHSTEAIKATIEEEIRRLADEGPAPQEMEKLRNNILNDFTRGCQSTLYRAQRLSEYALYDGDPELINSEIERYLSVTPEEIKRAAARYLMTDNYSLLEVVTAGAERGAEPAEAVGAPSGEPDEPGSPPPQVPQPPPADAPSTASAPLPAEPAAPPAAPGQPASPSAEPPPEV